MLVNIKQIVIGERNRKARKAQEIADSIKEIGLLNPITISKDYRLIAGLNRLEACKLLGYEKIECNILELSGLKAELAEIDENLIRDDLTAWEQGVWLADRKRIYLELYPETAREATLKQNRNADSAFRSVPSFTESTAEKSGQSKRTIETSIATAETLKPFAEDIEDLPIADKKTELLELAKIAKKHPEKAANIIEKLKQNPDKSLKEIEKQNSYNNVSKRIKEQNIETQSAENIKTAEEFNVASGDVYLINGRHKLIVNDAENILQIKNHLPIIDCILTDPPYGINYKSPSGNGLTNRGDYQQIANDDKDYNPELLFKYCDNIITWGANHYANKLPNSAGWIVWDKREGEQINNNSDCELAWSNMINSARLFHHKWNGMIKASEQTSKRVHPTQKPVKLFIYCLEITKAATNILDLYAGSGTTLIACQETNRDAFLVEKDLTYASVMLKRFIGEGYNVKKL